MSDAEPTAEDDFREFLLDLLAKSQHGKIPKIVNWFTECLDREFHTVEVHRSHVAIETIEAYGLEIGLDAVGNAVTVQSPEGFFTC